MSKVMFICRDPKLSPSVGIPVYVTQEALKKRKFPQDCRGGTITEDVSFCDIQGNVYIAFKVRHKNGEFVWHASQLVEIGGLTFHQADAENELPTNRKDTIKYEKMKEKRNKNKIKLQKESENEDTNME